MMSSKMVAVVGCTLVAAAAQAQFILPPDVPSKLKVVDISDWKITKADGKYLAQVKVHFVNKSEYHLVFRDPAFKLKIVEAEQKVNVCGVTASDGSVSSTTITFSDTQKANEAVKSTVFNMNVVKTLPEKTYDVGLLHRPTRAEWLMFNTFVLDGQKFVKDGKQKVESEAQRIAREFELKPLTKEGGLTVQEHEFTVELGADTQELKDKLLLEMFPLITSRDRSWSVSMSGETRIGIRNGDTTIFSTQPVEFDIRGKPAVKVDLSLE